MKTKLIVGLAIVLLIACKKDDGPVVEEQDLIEKPDSTTEPDPVNRAPVAQAGNDREVAIDSIVLLDASASTDLDGDDLTYAWSLLSAPEGSTTSINEASAIQADFTLDKAGDYEVHLQVSDGSSEATDKFTVSNKTPEISEVKRLSSNFPDLEDDIAERGSNIQISGSSFSPDLAENKVFLGDVECEIEPPKDYDGTITLQITIPGEAVTGDLTVTVGEKNNTWSKPIRLLEKPLEAFISGDTLVESKRTNPSTYFEVGMTFKPLINGDIVALGAHGPARGSDQSARLTLWDVENGVKIVSITGRAEPNERTWSKLESPVAVQAGKEYRVTMFHNDWYLYGRVPREAIFPRTYYNIEIMNTVSSEEPYDRDYDGFELPTFVEPTFRYLYDAVDIGFVPNVE